MVPVRFRKDPDRTIYTSYQCSCGQKARVGDAVYWMKPGEKGRPRKVALGG